MMHRSIHFLICCILIVSCKQSNHEKENISAAVNGKEKGTIDYLRITYDFDSNPEEVFDAFTVPENMKVWWTESTTFDVDLRVGGKWKIIRTQDENVYTALGEYLEVKRPVLLKYSYSMPQFSENTDTITIALQPNDDSGCRMIWEQRGVDIASELKQVPEGEESQSEIGWRMGFDLINEALIRDSSGI